MMDMAKMMEMTTLVAGLVDNDGATLKGFKSVTYKSGYQVATTGIETHSIAEAVRAIMDYQGDCGIWYSEGVYYVDGDSHRVSTLKQAMTIGLANAQLTILRWSDMECLECCRYDTIRGRMMR